MKRILTASVAIMTLAASSMADITVNVAPSVTKKEFNVRNRYIKDLTLPRMDRPDPITSTSEVQKGKFILPTMKDGNAETVITVNDNEAIVLYTRPGENMTVNIESDSPLKYSVTGSKLNEDIARLDMASSELLQEFRSTMNGNAPDEATVHNFNERYNKIISDYIAANKDAEAVAYAVNMLEEEDFLNAFAQMTDKARTSIIYPLTEAQKKIVERNIEFKKRLAQLQSGTYDAPDFTFNNAEGKPVSLSDFRGKWVVIDFWGTWCPWCIKGFPALKQAYAELKPKLEVLGVACNDKYDNWVSGIKRFDLPWVNVYNPEKGGGQILEEYCVEGFPTKVIVSPEGKIVNITSGEDPSFFDILRNLVK